MKYVDNPFKYPRVLSLCTGIGGIERGIKRAIGPIRTVAYVEIEAFIIENLLVGLEAGLVDAAPIWANLKTFPAQEFRGAVDGIIGGYPCQPFSTAGNRQGENDPRHLWPYIRNAVDAIRPVWCFFENVAGHLSLGYGEVYRNLRDMGYSVEAGIYTAEEVGAPHERKRLFILAISTRELQQWRRCPRGWWGEFTNSSQELANSHGNGHGAGNGSEKLGNSVLQGFSSKWIGDGQQDRFGKSSEKMGNSDRQRLQGVGFEPIQKEEDCQRNQVWAGATGTGTDLWPAGQGNFQHDWEEPRTIEPGMGCAIDGYNFREDILRALGNSVVEQTAELAFIDLLRKHIA